MAFITPSQPSGNGTEIEENGTNTYLVRSFSNPGHLSVKGTVKSVSEYRSTLLQRIKDKTGGTDPVHRVTTNSTPYEIVRYYFNDLHLTDIIAIHLLIDYPVTTAPSELYLNGRKGYMAGSRFIHEGGVYEFAREVFNSKVPGRPAVDWNSWITSQILYEAEQQASKDKTNADPNSPWNPASQYYDPSGSISRYDKEKGYIIYTSGKVVDTKNGLTYLVEAQGLVTAYDSEKGTVTYASGAVLDLKTMKLTTKEGVIQVTEQNPKPWYFKIFGSLLTDSKTQMIVAGVLVLLLILKKRFYEKS